MFESDMIFTRARQVITALSFAFVLASCGGQNDIYDRASEEYLEPVRPGYEGRQPYWNAYANKFIYAPAFDFAAVDGAVTYKYTVTYLDALWTKPVPNKPELSYSELIPESIPADAQKWSFTAEAPNLSLAPVWNDIPAGNVLLTVEALDKDGNVKGLAGARRFLRDFPFDHKFNEPARDYKEAAIMAALYVHNMPAVQHWLESTEPDMSYTHNTYPCKIIGATVRLEVLLASLVPSMKEDCLKIARNAAQFLMDQSRPEGEALAHFPPTYYKGLIASARQENQNKTMTMEACSAGNAYLDLYDATGEKLYYDEAIAIADTYVKIQNPDGSFPIKVDFLTGEPVNKSCAMLHAIQSYLQRLDKQYGVKTYREMQAKGEKWMEEVAIESFDITGQFEDVTVLGLHPYQNLTNCTAAPYASYLLSKDDMSKKDLANAIDLIRLSEDQFVHWDALSNEQGVRPIATPCVYEQYKYQVPVDASTCNVSNALLCLYEKTGDELALAKAKALLNNLTIIQNPCNGCIFTTFTFRPATPDSKRSLWINCSYASISTLLRLGDILEK